MADLDARTIPLDSASATALAAEGLDYRLVDRGTDAFPPFLRSVARGFLDAAPTDEQVEDSREAMSPRRLVGVFDPRSSVPDAPVATIDSWVTQLTTQPGRTTPMWAISGVTVAPTHRRRGIARAMLTGELRAALAAGLPLVGLTVSEATIYGRWGFSPAVYTSDWRVDASRVRWIGPRPEGRLDFIAQDALPARLEELHERTRLLRPGQVAGWPGLWRRMAGLRPGAEDGRAVRAVAWHDAEGAGRGILVYTLHLPGDDYTRHELRVQALFTETDDAYAALWRFALEHDLVSTVTASLQEADAPLRWMLSDQRGATVSLTEHHWLRILDVPGALATRAYPAHGESLVLRVDDSEGLAAGTFRITVGTGGDAETTRTDAAPDAELSVAALASLFLGGVRASALRAGGLIRADADVIRRLDALFAPAAPPRLDIWY